MLNFGRIYDYEKQRKKQGKWRKIRKKSLEKLDIDFYYKLLVRKWFGQGFW